MLRWRLVGAVAVLFPLGVLIWLDDQYHGGRPGIWLSGFAILVGLLACLEINSLLARSLEAVSPRVNCLALLATLMCATIPVAVPSLAGSDSLGALRWSFLGLASGLALIFGHELRRFQGPGESIARLAGGCMAVSYLGLPLSCLICLRIRQPDRLGLLALFSTLLVVKLSDTGAYLIGRVFGRTPLTVISPKKTWEGLVGGLLFALGGAWLTRQWLLPQYLGTGTPGNWVAYGLYGTTLMVIGLAGDLTESVLKRDGQLKDSSHLLPGLGGSLDVIDSVLAVAPVSLWWWSSGYLW